MASDSEKLVKDWQDVLKQAKQMEEGIEKLVGPAFLSSFKLHSFCRFLENIDLWGVILIGTNRERILSFTRYAPRFIDLHTI